MDNAHIATEKELAELLMSIDSPSVIDGFFDGVPEISGLNDYWLVRTESGKYYTDFTTNGYIGVGYNEIGLNDVKKSTPEELKLLLKDKENSGMQLTLDIDDSSLTGDEVDIQSSDQKIAIAAEQLYAFVNKISKDDLVLVPSKRSKTFSLGRVLDNNPYELDELPSEYDNMNYEHSPYLKRYNVKWLGSFNRDDADSKLYKMIFSQKAVNKINKYRDVINRAVFPIYILDDDVHVTFTVTELDNISMQSFGEFIYKFSLLLNEIENNANPSAKANVQSPGPIETITKSKKAIAIGLTVLAVTGGASAMAYGGELEVAGVKVSLNGVLKQQAQDNKINAEASSIKEDTQNKSTPDTTKELTKNVEIVQKAYDLKVSINDLGLDLPKGKTQRLQHMLNKMNEKNSPASDTEEHTN